MKEMLMSEMGFWTVFTLLFIFGFMGYFVYKMIKLSAEKQTPIDHH